ncbi:cell growth regulating nucleolar LYAR, partial [Fusarium albosuccineum]
ACGDVLTKKKLDPHRNRCRGATFTCIDCMVHFPGLQYRSHTSCMTEDQKYQGALYKNNKNKKQKHSHPNYDPATPQQNPIQAQAPALTQTTIDNDNNTGTMSHHAYVEDFPEDRDFGWAEYE